MAETKNEGLAAARSLAEKGDGVLNRVGNVWTYPGCPLDNSGTNLRLPLESVPDAVVRAALADGDAHGVVQGFGGDVMAVRFGKDGEEVTAITLGQAGTSEAGTELPLNSRPTHDAARPLVGATPKENLAEADKAGHRAAAAAHRPAKPAA